MVTKDLSNPTIKTYAAYLIKNFSSHNHGNYMHALNSMQLNYAKFYFYRYLTGLVNLTHVVFVLFLFELKITNSRCQLDLVGIGFLFERFFVFSEKISPQIYVFELFDADLLLL